MMQSQLIGLLIYSSIATLLAVLLVLAAVATSGKLHRFGMAAGPALLVLLMFGSAINVALSGRDLSLVGLMPQVEGFGSEEIGYGPWVNRGIIFLVNIGALATLLYRFARRDNTSDAGTHIVAAFALMSLMASFLPSIFGTVPTFYHNQLYPLLAVIVISLSPLPTLERLLLVVKGCIALLLLMSLAIAVVKPDLVLQSSYKGWVPGMTVRLWGLASHANLIGPVALVLFAVEYALPSSVRWHRYSLNALALSVLVMSQSKTNWLVLVVVVGILMHARSKLSRADAIRIGPSGMQIVGLVTTMVAALALWGAMLFLDPVGPAGSFSDSAIASDLETGSNRVGIWNLAIQEFIRNPSFGYGPSIWEPLYRFEHGMLNYAFHAHNLLLQTLSMSGAVGLIGLILYLVLLAVLAVRGYRVSRGLTVAMFAMLLVRGVSEVPLPLKALFSPDLWLHLVLLLFLRVSQHRVQALSSGVAERSLTSRISSPVPSTWAAIGPETRGESR